MLPLIAVRLASDSPTWFIKLFEVRRGAPIVFSLEDVLFSTILLCIESLLGLKVDSNGASSIFSMSVVSC